MQKSKTKHKPVKRSRVIVRDDAAVAAPVRVVPLPDALAAKLAETDAKSKVTAQERRLGLEAEREIMAEAVKNGGTGKGTTYSNPQDFFSLVRKMKNKESAK